MPPPDHFFRHWLAPRHISDKGRHKAAQVGAPVEPVGEGSQVDLAVLSVLQRMERTGQRGLEVTQPGLDPLELGQVLRLEGIHHTGQVNAAGVGDCGEAAQAITEADVAGRQAGLGPLADRLGNGAADQVEFQVRGPTVLIQRQRRHEQHLVLRPVARLAPRALSTVVGFVQLHRAVHQVGGLQVSHVAVDLLVQQPRAGVANAHIALEPERRQPSLGLADEMDGQERGDQRQLAMLDHRAGRHRSLVPAADALKQLAGTLAEEVVPRVVAARAVKPLGPTRSLQSFDAMLFSAEVPQEFGDRHAGMELDLWLDIGALRRQESSGYKVSSS
jgi:hypothetical protein